MKKVLIISGGLQVGGAERVAANISKYAPNGEFEFHYIVFEGIDNVYGAEIEKKGDKVFTFPQPSSGYFRFIKMLKKLMDENNYIAIHSHTMFNSGITLFLAKIQHIPCRIAHSHTTKTERKVSWLQKLYQGFMRGVIKFSANHYFACGIQAGYWLFGKRAFEKKGIVINNGIDTTDFKYSEESRNLIRKQYGLEDTFIIGHSGTLIPLKNQEFLITLLPKIIEQNPKTVLLLLGGGNEENTSRLKKIVEDNGVGKSVIFCGQVMNVHEYLSAFDVFAFPSLREGTPLALLEAQTNGLPCIVSDNIPKDAFLTDLVQPLPLEDKNAWIHSICDAKRQNCERYVLLIDEAGYSVATAYDKIYRIYEGKE
ncbi:MAG: glycosyltransferase [Ruminococcus sp.]|nr:glycosyltransferase [Ruminococcus sp.]